MVAVREAIYSLLEKRKPTGGTVNLLGNFTHLEDDSDLYDILGQMGIKTIHEVGRKETLEDTWRWAEQIQYHTSSRG